MKTKTPKSARLSFTYATWDAAIQQQLSGGIVITSRPKNKQKYYINQPVALVRGRFTPPAASGHITNIIPFGDGSQQLTVQLYND